MFMLRAISGLRIPIRLRCKQNDDLAVTHSQTDIQTLSERNIQTHTKAYAAHVRPKVGSGGICKPAKKYSNMTAGYASIVLAIKYT